MLHQVPTEVFSLVLKKVNEGYSRKEILNILKNNEGEIFNNWLCSIEENDNLKLASISIGLFENN